MELQQVPIDTLVLDPENARLHNDRNKDSVRASIKEFGQVEVLVIQKGTNRVIGGNCRLQEMRRLGHDKVWVAEVDVDDKKANKLALALNRTSELAEWDDKVLGKLLAELENDRDLSGLGWNDSEVDKLLADTEDQWLASLGEGPLPDGAVIGMDDHDHPRMNNNIQKMNKTGPGKYTRLEFGEMMCSIPTTLYDRLKEFADGENYESLQDTLIAVIEGGLDNVESGTTGREHPDQ